MDANINSPIAVLSLIFFRRRSPAARCFKLKSLTIHSEIVPLPEPGAPIISALREEKYWQNLNLPVRFSVVGSWWQFWDCFIFRYRTNPWHRFEIQIIFRVIYNGLPRISSAAGSRPVKVSESPTSIRQQWRTRITELFCQGRPRWLKSNQLRTIYLNIGASWKFCRNKSIKVHRKLTVDETSRSTRSVRKTVIHTQKPIGHNRCQREHCFTSVSSLADIILLVKLRASTTFWESRSINDMYLQLDD